ncbi:MAG: CTP synthase [Candidatus Doudnabacteria bacterium RIFCSPHIGHO2_02_FULL_48_21]|uniref:CTP synthase n=1 Tax=Candidatus Doudnabacteria bacterium RIFCSPLOWO2_02_FULL_48_13 TaxID=1817845 RepID=A0A1F5QAF2_9BACT|nr:MAG: CTP synthase [Candidatus Doudnabacteria bacterium RIFCSPHIGHO2_01_48_18]OGE78858.1 MAG: CTP synthase [Candidatus Doudnabacteria bacterium RIFCSPHIGHO2_01_FULL_48_180]OGE91849.1 MAG: CTP synthase [Candidatus Doudnabacteria bacterium RIFCSPHIGHO2_12_FULL_47_25]OGE94086.1 MAG: CTP synthase [Candidatus Doudnabacteria bacterium RIFCSPHIGHO2_02_FULL_48_21]OGE98208.1 MAG: CTP synthase [Candidatus Doudnabacteria bacterium RIFCSPLOWO2_01_FULL_48_57]OGE99107.1 MAG: CTP synthase [Candidatus Doudn
MAKQAQTNHSQTRYIFVIGGVMSSVGKGVTTASIGRILLSKGYRVGMIKCDMYVNIDAGTMRPTEHGEVFVGSDGIEADQDLGNYERFTGNLSTRDNYVTTGQIYQEVIRRERNLEYKGEDVEVVPDIPNEIIRRINVIAKKGNPDFVIVEIGGTVGEYQNVLFLEAGRMLKLQNPGRVQFALVSYLPVPKMVGEMKTKPTQYAVRTLNSAGIQPDFIIGRSELPMDEKRKQKLSLLCSVAPGDVISAPDAESIYEVPLIMEKDRFGDKILEKFGMRPRKQDLRDWKALVRKIKNAKLPLNIGVVGKYFNTGDYTLVDSYISVVESLRHSAWANNRVPKLHWINSEDFEKNPSSVGKLAKMDGILVPGGFGGRGVEGILAAIKFAREKKIPYFGLCYGMQLAVVEFARNVAKMGGANSTEVDRNTKYPVIDVMEEQKKNLADKNFGATMRLGDYPCKIIKGTLAFDAYKTGSVVERHRHRYEVNNKYRNDLEKHGMIFSGIYPKKDLVEISELRPKLHPWFLGVQFHPEFNSRPWKPQALFDGFIKAAVKKSA